MPYEALILLGAVLIHGVLVGLCLLPFSRVLRRTGLRARLPYLLPAINVTMCLGFLFLEQPLDGSGLAYIQRGNFSVRTPQGTFVIAPYAQPGPVVAGRLLGTCGHHGNSPCIGTSILIMLNFPAVLATAGGGAAIRMLPLALPSMSLLGRSWMLYLAFLQACAAYWLLIALLLRRTLPSADAGAQQWR